jgi:hypothetical protein
VIGVGLPLSDDLGGSHGRCVRVRQTSQTVGEVVVADDQLVQAFRSSEERLRDGEHRLMVRRLCLLFRQA